MAGYTLLHTATVVQQEPMTPEIWTSHKAINLQGENRETTRMKPVHVSNCLNREEKEEE